jgi:hypothetical protein
MTTTHPATGGLAPAALRELDPAQLHLDHFAVVTMRGYLDQIDRIGVELDNDRPLSDALMREPNPAIAVLLLTLMIQPDALDHPDSYAAAVTRAVQASREAHARRPKPERGVR